MILSPWWRHQMEKNFRVTGPLCREFTGHRWIPLTKASDAELDVFFDRHLNKLLSKQSRGWWFEKLSRPLWRHCKVARSIVIFKNSISHNFISTLSYTTRRCYNEIILVYTHENGEAGVLSSDTRRVIFLSYRAHPNVYANITHDSV